MFHFIILSPIFYNMSVVLYNLIKSLFGNYCVTNLTYFSLEVLQSWLTSKAELYEQQ